MLTMYVDQYSKCKLTHGLEFRMYPLLNINVEVTYLIIHNNNSDV
jgi:hypothetical protein